MNMSDRGTPTRHDSDMAAETLAREMYSDTEAARLLHVPTPTFRRWLGGGLLCQVEAAEPLGDVFDLQNAHDVAFRFSAPSTPRGKNSTTAMNSTPTKDIQLVVTLDR